MFMCLFWQVFLNFISPEIFQKNLLELEKKDAEQSDNIKQLISSVSQLSEKVTSLCEIVEVSNKSPRQQDGYQSDAQKTGNKIEE